MGERGGCCNIKISLVSLIKFRVFGYFANKFDYFYKDFLYSTSESFFKFLMMNRPKIINLLMRVSIV